MNYLKFILFLLLPYAIYSQQNVDINEQFEGSWMPSGWQSSNFSQTSTMNHSGGGSRSAMHGISLFGTATLTSNPFQVIAGEQFDTISFWVRHSAITLTGSITVDLIGNQTNSNLGTINLGILPNNTWVRYSYSYNVSVTDTVSVRLSFSHGLTVGFLYVDDIRVRKSLMLPVTLSYFNHSTRENNVSLKWGTTDEMNNMGFEVYRSDAGSGSWSKIAFVNGHGTTSIPQDYSFTDPKLNTGKYIYKLKQVDFNGNFEYFALAGEVKISAPGKFELEQNYPNPSNPTTTIGYMIPSDALVKIVVYDMAGKEVQTLVNAQHTAGYHKAEFNGSGLSSGIYIYKITAGDYSNVKKMILIK